MIPEKTQSVLELLYEAYMDKHNTTTEQIREDFRELNMAVQDIPLKDCDKIIDPVCALCWSHEKNGFINGVKIGMQLYRELTDAEPAETEECVQ